MRNEIKGLKNVQQDDLIRIVPSENKLNNSLIFSHFKRSKNLIFRV